MARRSTTKKSSTQGNQQNSQGKDKNVQNVPTRMTKIKVYPTIGRKKLWVVFPEEYMYELWQINIIYLTPP